MKLTHHSTPSRSFILLTIIVLCTVYAALVLTRINKLYLEETEVPAPQPTTLTESERTLEQIPQLDTTDWVEYNDDVYPFTIYVPKGWRIKLNDQIENLYLVSITQTSPQSLIRIFITKVEPERPALTPTQTFKTNSGYEVTNYNNTIYQVKVGDVYYTFDGSAAPESKDLLKTIVSSTILN